MENEDNMTENDNYSNDKNIDSDKDLDKYNYNSDEDNYKNNNIKLTSLKDIIEKNPDNPRLKEIIYNNSAKKITNLLRSNKNQKLRNKNISKNNRIKFKG